MNRGDRSTPTDASPRVIVIDDDPLVTRSIAEFLREQGVACEYALDAPGGLARIADDPASYTVAIVDVSMPKATGLDVLAQVRRKHPHLAVVMLTGYPTVEVAVESLRGGAVDFLTKPVVDDELLGSVRRAHAHALLIAPPRESRISPLTQIAGEDPRMRRIAGMIESVAPSRTTVLMTGESGVGKSMVARAIHAASPRRAEPFVEISCGSIPETLLESELFGHVKGAFTGAHADKVGRFKAADKGTIFLDEINSASPAMQLKLLRVLQERRFEPVGSSSTMEVDTRVLLASNQPLAELVASGQFRQDLYYRINVIEIEIPPLRQRVADIPVLAGRFLARFGAELGKQLTGFSDEAMHLLCAYHYPGNVRELQNIVERAAVLAQKPTIATSDLPDFLRTPDARPASHTAVPLDLTEGDALPLEEFLRRQEHARIVAELNRNKWGRQQTADALGINRATLYKKMRALGIESSDGREAG